MPISPGCSMMRVSLTSILSMNGATEVNGAISSATFTIASTGISMLAGPTVLSRTCQDPMTEAVLAIKPVENLIDQLARKHDLVERPTLNAGVSVQGGM